MNRIKILKYIVIFFLTAVFMALPGELYQGYIDQFNDLFLTTFYLPKDCTAEEMKREMLQEAEKYHLNILKIIESDSSAFSHHIDIYAKSEAFEYLEQNYLIAEGTTKSVFSGSTVIKYFDFDSIDEELIRQDVNYYLIGDYENMCSFKSELVDKYAGSFPREYGINILSSCRMTLMLSLLILVILYILLTRYDIKYQKKEIFLNYIHGTPLRTGYWKNLKWDSLFLVVISAGFYALLVKSEGNVPFLKYIPFGIAILLISNFFLYLSLFKVDHKMSLSDADVLADRGKLKFSYFLQGVCFAATIIIISSNIASIYSCMNYYSQKKFFEEYNEYYWYNGIRNDNVDVDVDTTPIINHFLKQYLEEMEIFYLCQGTEISEKNNKLFYEANSNTIAYLKTKIDVLNEIPLENDTYILMHKNEKLSADDLEELLSWTESEDTKIITYDNNAKILYREFDSEPITNYVKNPVIILYNRESYGDTSDEGTPYQFFLCMVKTDHEIFDAYMQTYGLKYNETNVLDYFYYRWTSLLRLLLLSTVTMMLIIFMEMILCYTVLSLEFKVNAVELSLMKVQGYTLFERYRKIFLSNASIWGICVLALFVVSSILQSGMTVYLMIGAVLLLVLDLGLILFLIRYYERKKVIATLKGGAL